MASPSLAAPVTIPPLSLYIDDRNEREVERSRRYLEAFVPTLYEHPAVVTLFDEMEQTSDLSAFVSEIRAELKRHRAVAQRKMAASRVLEKAWGNKDVGRQASAFCLRHHGVPAPQLAQLLLLGFLERLVSRATGLKMHIDWSAKQLPVRAPDVYPGNEQQFLKDWGVASWKAFRDKLNSARRPTQVRLSRLRRDTIDRDVRLLCQYYYDRPRRSFYSLWKDHGHWSEKTIGDRIKLAAVILGLPVRPH